ncbi:MAG: threonine synthase [Planctomycetes bacterium]|nr:threonine synthase [Planctomycetota bacterium]
MTINNAMIIACASCGKTLSDRTPHATCPQCDGLLDITPASPPARGAALQKLFDTRASDHAMRGTPIQQSGVWRFRELVLPTDDASIVSHPEGNTPLLHRNAISHYAGIDSLRMKHEGHNPTGSFKDRGMTVAVTQARRCGATAIACASTGNTSSSLASYAAHAGIPALVMVPVGRISMGKLAQTVAYGARTLLVRGDFDDCLRLVRESAQSLGVYLGNSLNPFRIEGQKTIIFELLQQCEWNPPDWIALPAGNLGNTSAFGKALREAHELGLIEKIPRLLSVQASGAAPFAHAFSEDFVSRHKVRAETIATAIRIGDPASWDRGVAAIRFTNGVVAAVSDEAIMEAKSVIDASGVGCEPASAASVAGVKALVARGVIKPGESVVTMLTGHVLKDPEKILTSDAHSPHPHPHPHPRAPIEIDANLAAVERVLKSVAK